MLETKDILETINMIDNENLDVRTITMGISLLDCLDEDIDRACTKVYDKIMRSAKDLVKTGEDIESEYGIPIINKRISVTPIGMVAAPCQSKNVVRFAHALDKAAKELGGKGAGRELYRRLFGAGAKGLCQRRLCADGEHSAGAERNGFCVLLGQHRLHQGRHQHGRGQNDGKNRQADRRNHR